MQKELEGSEVVQGVLAVASGSNAVVTCTIKGVIRVRPIRAKRIRK